MFADSFQNNVHELNVIRAHQVSRLAAVEECFLNWVQIWNQTKKLVQNASTFKIHNRVVKTCESQNYAKNKELIAKYDKEFPQFANVFCKLVVVVVAYYR
jgi:hypothetical protein